MNTSFSKIRIVIYSLSLLFFIAEIGSAQSQRTIFNNTNGWYNYVGNFRMTDKFSLYGEINFRRNDLTKPKQLILRPALIYHINSNATFAVGYGFIHTSVYGALPVLADFNENRTWEQFQLKSAIGKAEWVGRFRLEQRSVHSPVKLTDGTISTKDAVNTGRFRLLNRISFPLTGAAIHDKSFYASIFNELFVNIGNNVKFNVFDQNRNYAGIGYVVPKFGRIELGYTVQKIFKSDGVKVENNHNITIQFNHNIDLRKKEVK